MDDPSADWSLGKILSFYADHPSQAFDRLARRNHRSSGVDGSLGDREELKCAPILCRSPCLKISKLKTLQASVRLD